MSQMRQMTTDCASLIYSQTNLEETEYITREEQEEMLLHAFTEMYRAQKEGIELRPAEELLNEL